MVSFIRSKPLQKKLTGKMYFRAFYYPDANVNKQEILSRYKFVINFVEGKKVIDLGCGARRGPWLLSEKAERVIGADISREAIFYAKKKWPRMNLAYTVFNATEVPFSDNVFDVVISFEVIEHIADYISYIKEVQRIVKPDGICILSTPNKYFGHQSNPEHIKEFSREELESLLSSYFEDVIFFGQKRTSRVKAAESVSRQVYQITRFDYFKLRRLFPSRLRDRLFVFFVYLLSKWKHVPQKGKIAVDDFKICADCSRESETIIVLCKNKTY